MLVEVVGSTICPVLGIVEFVGNLTTVVCWPPAPARIILVAMSNELLHSLVLDEVDDFACTLAIHEVAHKDAALVDEQVADVFILQHILQQSGGRLCVGPGVTRMVLRMIQQVNHVVVVLLAIESQSEVGILNDDAPNLGKTRFCVIVIGAPEDGVVAWPVVIAIEEIHHGYVQIFVNVNPLFVFCLGMALLAIEGLELVVEV